MKHLLIILISFLLLSSFLTSCEKKEETLYVWGEYPFEWREFGEKETHPKYIGEVENGVPNGKGIYTTPNGSKYVGDFKDGDFNGQGTYSWNNGEKFVGEFKDGLKNGQGTFTSFDGRKGVGEFKDGNAWNVKEYDKNGKFTKKFVNGKEIKQ